MPESTGNKILDRKRRLLGTDHFNEPDKTVDDGEDKTPGPAVDADKPAPPAAPVAAPMDSSPPNPPTRGEEGESKTDIPESPETVVTPEMETPATPASRRKRGKGITRERSKEASAEELIPPEIPKKDEPAQEKVLPGMPMLQTMPMTNSLGHETMENHPKVPWSVKVPLDMYDFIRDHDSYRQFLEDQRPFREKFLEWVVSLKQNVSPELNVAKDAAVRVRTHTPEPVPEAISAVQAGRKTGPEGPKEGESL
jgi:hypothetical protein